MRATSRILSKRAAVGQPPKVGSPEFRELPLQARIERSPEPFAGRQSGRGQAALTRMSTTLDKLESNPSTRTNFDDARARHYPNAYPSTAMSVMQDTFGGTAPESFLRDTSRSLRDVANTHPATYRDVAGLPDYDIPVAGGGPIRGEVTPRNIGTAQDVLHGLAGGGAPRMLSALLRQMRSYGPAYNEMGPVSEYDSQARRTPPVPVGE